MNNDLGPSYYYGSMMSAVFKHRSVSNLRVVQVLNIPELGESGISDI